MTINDAQKKNGYEISAVSDSVMNVPRMKQSIAIFFCFLVGLCFALSLHAQSIECGGTVSSSIEYGDSTEFQIEVFAYNAPSGASVSASYGAMTGSDSDFEILTPNFGTTESGRGPGYGFCSVRFRPTKNYPDSVFGFIYFSSNSGSCAVEVIGYVIHSTVGGYDSMATEYFSKVSWGTWRSPALFSIFSTRNEAQKVTFKVTGPDDTLFSITPDTLYLKKHGEASGTITYGGSYTPIVYDTLNIIFHSTVDSSEGIERALLIDSSIYSDCVEDFSSFGNSIGLPIAHDTVLTFLFASFADTAVKIESLKMNSFDNTEFGPLQLRDSILNPGASYDNPGPSDTCFCLFHPNLPHIIENGYGATPYPWGGYSSISFLGTCKPLNLLSCPTFSSSWNVWIGLYNPTQNDTIAIEDVFYPPIAFETNLDTTVVHCNFFFERDTGVFIPGVMPLGVSLEDSSHFRVLSFDTTFVVKSKWINGIELDLEIELIAHNEGTYSTSLLGHFQTGDSRSELAAYRTATSLVRTTPQLSDISIASDGTNRISVSTSAVTSLDCYDILGRLVLHRELQYGNSEIVLPDAVKGTIFFRFSRLDGNGKSIVETRKVLVE